MDPQPVNKPPRWCDSLWAELLANSPTPDQLLDVARCIPQLQEEAWAKYIETNPTAVKLLELLHSYNYHKDIKILAARHLVSLGSDAKTLVWIINNIPDAADQAAEKLMQHKDIEGRELNLIIWKIGRADLKERAAGLVLDKGITQLDTLNLIIRYVPSLRNRVAEIILAKESPEANELGVVIAGVPEMHARVWKMITKGQVHLNVVQHLMFHSSGEMQLKAGQFILEQDIHRDELFNYMFFVAKYNPSLREQVWQKLQTVGMSNTQLESLAREAPELAERALAKKVIPPRNAETILQDLLTGNACMPR